MMSFTGFTIQKKENFARTAIMVAYLIAIGITICHHELWGDELHSWNIAKASHSFADLIANSRYEGHPPVWYTLMWLLSRCTHNLAYLQCLQFFITSAAVYLLLFRSSLPIPAKALLPFGYYLLYEYGSFSRNYAIALLFAFAICALLQRKKTNAPAYYILLFLLSNTHLLGTLLAAAIHLYYLLSRKSTGAKRFLHMLIGGAVLLPALYFIFPPSDSELSMSFWVSHWSARQLSNITAAPVKALLPVPDWRQYHSWNTHILTDHFSPVITALVSLLLTAVALFILRKDRNCLLLFIVNLLLTAVIALIFPLTSARYVGFIYIGFIVSCWLYCTQKPFSGTEKKLFYFLLLLQICGSIIAVPRDLKLPFSNAAKVKQIVSRLPAGEVPVTDYWCLNNVAAYTDKPVYCIELKEQVSFLRWNNAFAKIIAMRNIYTESLDTLFHRTQKDHILLLSSNSPAEIIKRDATAFQHYRFTLTDSCTGAIEKHSDLYLYHVSPLNNN